MMVDLMSEKSPAFLCYASDLLVSTGEMSNAEFGAYWRMLCYQWVNGSINSNPNSHPIKYPNGEWEAIQSKFPVCSDGRSRNARLEKVRQERHNYLKKQSDAGKKGAEIRWGKDGDPNAEPNAILSSSLSSSRPPRSSPKELKKKKRREYPAMFEQLWKIHPKGGKEAAYKALKKLSPDESEVERWVFKLEAFRESQKWREGISPNLSTWINQGYFDGEVPVAKSPQSAIELGKQVRRELNIE